MRRHSTLEIHGRHLRHGSIIPRRGPPPSNVGDLSLALNGTLPAHFDRVGGDRQPCLLRIAPDNVSARGENSTPTTLRPDPKLPPV